MKIIRDYKEFYERTDALMYLDFEILDIKPDTLLGVFFPSRSDELMEFCRDNPEYHIISYLKDDCIEINTFVENAAFYRLAEGDADPDLIFMLDVSREEFAELRFLKFWIREGLA